MVTNALVILKGVSHLWKSLLYRVEVWVSDRAKASGIIEGYAKIRWCKSGKESTKTNEHIRFLIRTALH